MEIVAQFIIYYVIGFWVFSFNPLIHCFMDKKPLEKTKFSDLSKFTAATYKDNLKSAVASYVQFLSIDSLVASRDAVASAIGDIVGEVLEMIDFDK